MISALTPLLTLWIHIRQAQTRINLELLRDIIIAEIQLLQTKLSAENIPQEIIVIIVYCICTALDESVLNSQADELNTWASQPLLSEFHQETWGGERFYQYLNDCLKRDTDDPLLFQAFYLLLSLGFEGKLYGQPEKREHIRQMLIHKIQRQGSEHEL